ncbi:hypothetical protein QR680_006384 [Steinernema hermaphroditum]|uniref:G-protein coupled receptors family 1 profile domain-containing protein n=1 Tax=Steinernema hermaphroditum TaxID=289476 RepID=A0AA39HWQ4_9BILA|nr:hypothetical protein QR680_006384 [Steinernema hermaphroditum]
MAVAKRRRSSCSQKSSHREVSLRSQKTQATISTRSEERSGREDSEVDVRLAVELLRFRPEKAILRHKTSHRLPSEKQVRIDLSENVLHLYPQTTEWDDTWTQCTEWMEDGRTAYPKESHKGTSKRGKKKRSCTSSFKRSRYGDQKSPCAMSSQPQRPSSNEDDDVYGRSLIGIYRLYITLGGFAVSTNAVLLLALVTSKVFRRKGVIIMVLVFADLVNGIAFIVSGKRRIDEVIYRAENHLSPIVAMRECAAEPSPALYVIGGQWPAVLTLMLGVERLTAVAFPWWYRELYERHQVVTALAASLFVVVSLAVGISYGLIVTPDAFSIYICSIGKSYGMHYATYNYALTISGHIVGFIATMVAFMIARNRIEQAGFNRRREMQSLKLIFFISLLSLIFIVVPNIYLILDRFLPHVQSISGYMYCAFCLRSCFNIALMGFLNKDLRQHIKKMYARFANKYTTQVDSTRIFSSRQ